MSSIPDVPRTAVQGIWAPSRQPSSYKGIFFPFLLNPLGNSTPTWLLLLGPTQAEGLGEAENCLSLLDIHPQS